MTSNIYQKKIYVTITISSSCTSSGQYFPQVINYTDFPNTNDQNFISYIFMLNLCKANK